MDLMDSLGLIMNYKRKILLKFNKVWFNFYLSLIFNLLSKKEITCLSYLEKKNRADNLGDGYLIITELIFFVVLNTFLTILDFDFLANMSVAIRYVIVGVLVLFNFFFVKIIKVTLLNKLSFKTRRTIFKYYKLKSHIRYHLLFLVLYGILLIAIVLFSAYIFINNN